MSTIPVTEVVQVTPGVLATGGSAFALTGLVLTTSTRPPIGSVLQFSSQAAVAAYFGATSNEAQNATVYFNGFDNSNKKPGAILFAQYPSSAVSAFLRGGNVSALTLTQLQALNSILTVTVDSVQKSNTVNLSAATSFSNAGSIIGKALGISGAQQGSFSGAISATTLTVSSYVATNGGALGVGSVISGAGVTAGTYITALGTGTGGNGTYTVSDSQSVSVAMTGNAGAVTYDSVSGGFTIASGTTGVNSTISFATGAMATSLLLTAALGAVTSQGSAAATPAAFMNTLILNTRAWATFMLNFNPDQSGNANRLAFATWAGGQGNRFAYVGIDDDATPTVTLPATTSLAQLVTAAGISGACINWQSTSLANTINYGDLCAFVSGMVASVDFTQAGGRITAKFKSQSGLTPSVTDQTSFDNLVANGYNCYGAYASADSAWQWYANGTISGVFQWLDSFINQIWLNTQFKDNLVNLLKNTNSIPYNAAGRALTASALADTIQQGLNFGAYRAGVTLSASQIAAVNNNAGFNISDTLSNQGWYLLIKDAPTNVRQARGSFPMTFYYVDGEAVQNFSMSSIALQ